MNEDTLTGLIVQYFFAICGTGLLFPLITYFIKYWWEKRKRITIEAEELFRIDRNGILEKINEDKEYYSNPFYHRITVKSNNEETISAIELYDIKIENKEFSEIRFDVGFNEELQKYILIAINNGNTTIDIDNAFINISFVEKITFRIIESQKIELPKMFLNSGEVVSMITIDMVNYNKKFNQDLNLYALRIESQINTQTVPLMHIIYDQANNIFRGPQLGCGLEPANDFLIFNIIENQKCIKKECAYIVQNVKHLGFVSMIEKSCQLRYKVRLFSKKKTIISDKLHVLNIRIPKYCIERDSICGPFYLWVLKINPNLEKFKITFDVVSEQNKNLIYNDKLILELLQAKQSQN